MCMETKFEALYESYEKAGKGETITKHMNCGENSRISN
jgi:hypothetical protein